MKRVVIIDDEELIRIGMTKLIEESGRNYRVIGAFSNGKEALNTLMNADIDVVITDIRMPEMDGLELIKVVRDMNIDVSFIILSGYSDFEYARTALRYDVKDYILKPIDQNELFACIDKIDCGNDEDTQLDNELGKGNKRVVDMVKQIIETEYDKNINLTEIANRVYLNPKYLSRMFKKETGLNIIDYLLHVRINMAKQLLRENLDFKVYEVANMVGYTDSVFFNKLFKKLVGMTPKEYKDQINKKW